VGIIRCCRGGSDCGGGCSLVISVSVGLRIVGGCVSEVVRVLARVAAGTDAEVGVVIPWKFVFGVFSYRYVNGAALASSSWAERALIDVFATEWVEAEAASFELRSFALCDGGGGGGGSRGGRR
jgi:hypothetical protein